MPKEKAPNPKVPAKKFETTSHAYNFRTMNNLKSKGGGKKC